MLYLYFVKLTLLRETVGRFEGNRVGLEQLQLIKILKHKTSVNEFLIILRASQFRKNFFNKKIPRYLLQQSSYTVYDNKQFNSEVKRVLENITKTRKILIWSETNQVGSINGSRDYLKLHSYIDTVIIASRTDDDNMRRYLWQTLDINNQVNNNFEIPLGRMKRGPSRSNAVNWYLQNVQKVAEIMGRQIPFSF